MHLQLPTWAILAIMSNHHQARHQATTVLTMPHRQVRQAVSHLLQALLAVMVLLAVMRHLLALHQATMAEIMVQINTGMVHLRDLHRSKMVDTVMPHPVRPYINPPTNCLI